MATNILLKRGNNFSFSTVILKSGEPAFLTDIGKLYIGDGTKKVLINPIDKPIGINTSNFYTKLKVNEYGQVIGQSALNASDIPIISNTQVSGLGTASILNVGTSSGNLPTLDNTGRLSESIMPLSVLGSGIITSYNGTNGILVNPNQYVPLSVISSTGSGIYSLEANSLININQTGLYLVTYTISSATLLLNTALGSGVGTVNWIGSFARSSTTAVSPYTTTSATIMRLVGTVPEKFGIKNVGTTDISLISGYASISIVKIG